MIRKTPHEIITIKCGDITSENVDAIVIAIVNDVESGGDDSALHRRAGPALLTAYKGLGDFPTGETRITDGYNLPAKHIIHTVGPIWSDGSHGENELLRTCYRNSFNLALKHGLRSIAFPAISTGTNNFPPDRAALIALATILGLIKSQSTVDIVFVCLDEQSKQRHDNALAALTLH